MPPAVLTSCTTTPNQRVVEVQTLKAIGHTAESAVQLSAQLYKDGRITALEARNVIDFYDTKFQSVFRVAVNAAQANLDTIASPEVISLAAQLSALVLQLQHPTP
jgi:hypothetical protein